MPRLSVEWGYELYSIIVDDVTWARIRKGVTLSVTGEGYEYEGDSFTDVWTFNATAPGTLVVSYDGGTGYDGPIPEPDEEEE